jgi:hypothetical protein
MALALLFPTGMTPDPAQQADQARILNEIMARWRHTVLVLRAKRPGICRSRAATTSPTRRFCKGVWENIHEDSSNERHRRRCWHRFILCFLCFGTEHRDAAAKPAATGCPGSSPGTAGHDASGWRAG